MRRQRHKRGERRMDAAIHHLAQYGFAKPQIRKIINDLLQVDVPPLAHKSFFRALGYSSVHVAPLQTCSAPHMGKKNLT
jgi:hypothetical protein